VKITYLPGRIKVLADSLLVFLAGLIAHHAWPSSERILGDDTFARRILENLNTALHGSGIGIYLDQFIRSSIRSNGPGSKREGYLFRLNAGGVSRHRGHKVISGGFDGRSKVIITIGYYRGIGDECGLNYCCQRIDGGACSDQVEQGLIVFGGKGKPPEGIISQGDCRLPHTDRSPVPAGKTGQHKISGSISQANLKFLIFWGQHGKRPVIGHSRFSCQGQHSAVARGNRRSRRQF
jgi:hypothetical protein